MREPADINWDKFYADRLQNDTAKRAFLKSLESSPAKHKQMRAVYNSDERIFQAILELLLTRVDILMYRKSLESDNEALKQLEPLDPFE